MLIKEKSCPTIYTTFKLISEISQQNSNQYDQLVLAACVRRGKTIAA